MLKVGDKVRIRQQLVAGRSYGGFKVAQVMAVCRGKTAYIEKIRDDGSYQISIAWSGYRWAEEMLELIENAPDDDPLASGRLVALTPEEHSAAYRKDMVNHPPHYTKRGLETIEVIKGGVDDFKSYCAGNVIKYVSRYPYKNGVEDLKKAKWYLDKLIQEVEENK